MTDLARLDAMQAKADSIALQVGDWDGVGPRLLVSITDPETNTRVATAFAGYEVDSPAIPVPLRLVREGGGDR